MVQNYRDRTPIKNLKGLCISCSSGSYYSDPLQSLVCVKNKVIMQAQEVHHSSLIEVTTKEKGTYNQYHNIQDSKSFGIFG